MTETIKSIFRSLFALYWFLAFRLPLAVVVCVLIKIITLIEEVIDPEEAKRNK